MTHLESIVRLCVGWLLLNEGQVKIVNGAVCYITMYMFVGIAVPYFVYWNKDFYKLS